MMYLQFIYLNFLKGSREKFLVAMWGSRGELGKDWNLIYGLKGTSISHLLPVNEDRMNS
jgi:hypothetical protein